VPEGKVLDSGYLYMGRPARRIRQLSVDEIAHFMYSANQYIQLKNQYLA
jgi:carbonic anhydrase/acetyltransferase-like protein (isoleucine patch superfamily)